MNDEQKAIEEAEELIRKERKKQDATTFAEALLSTLGALEEPQTPQEALRLIKAIEDEVGDLCDIFAESAFQLANIAIDYRANYQKTNEMHYKILSEVMGKALISLISHHEAYHLLRKIAEQQNT